MSRHRLPPLNAIKAFEVTARTGTFTRAAVELGVSSAAVSQQIRNLEDWFGKQLFIRSGNRIVLTDAGHAVYLQASRALGELAAMSTRLLEGELRTRLVISVPFSLAETWLAPRVAKMLRAYPQAVVDIRVEDDPVDLVRHGVDLRIGYGDYHYPGLKTLNLIQDDVLPVCTPEFWQQRGGDELTLDALDEGLFIHTNWGPSFASHPTWSDWFALAGSPRRLEPSRGRRVGLSSLAVSLARLGSGVALGQRIIVRTDLEEGGLIAPSTLTLRLGHPYCAFTPTLKADRPEVHTLIGLLRDAGSLSASDGSSADL